MKTPSQCAQCAATLSEAEVVSLMKNEWEKCRGCSHEETIQRAEQRFKIKSLQWVVASGSSEMPHWMIESLRRSI